MLRYSTLKDMRAGVLSLPDFLAQIESKFTEREPDVLACLSEEDRFQRLHEDAETLALSYPDPNRRPALFGALVGVKDIFHVEGFTTHAGSRLPSEILQGKEAESVTRLKNAGALILGKTVTTEFAYFTPGPTRNPHHLEHTPGGSSSGSAAAVAAGFCHIALGTQTIGSVIRPAAFCDVVGFKPTYERISREGVIPLSPTFDHIGFFTTDIVAAKQAANVLIRDWKLDSPTQKPILGIPEGPYLACASDYALACFNDLCQSLTDAGYELRHIRVMDDFQEIRNRHDAIMAHDVSQVHKNWFAKYETLYSAKFSDLIKRGRSVSNLQSLLFARDALRTSITQAMEENQIDIWVCPPAVGPAPKGLDSTGDPVMCLPWTQIGFPAVNIPTTKNEAGLPMGLQLVGKWDADESLLAWAEDIEKVVRKI
ncbi:MAG: amidase [Anaerolineales bacterium]|nr:MAG: amidase [Anaerolineales bacterium]